MKNHILFYKYQYLAITVFFFYFFPSVFLFEDSYITIHDNLDSDFVWQKVLKESNKTFVFDNDCKIDNYMNGIPRNSMPSSFNLVTIIYYLCNDSLLAYMLNKIILHIIAFIGMNLFLKDFLFTEKHEKKYVYLISILFGTLPFYASNFSLSIPGVPIILWCLTLAYLERLKYWHYIIIFLFGLYSSLVYIGFFILIPSFIIISYQFIFKKRIKSQMIRSSVILLISYFLSDLNIIIQYFSSEYISNRIERVQLGNNFINTLRICKSFLLNGQYHAKSENKLILAPLILTISILYVYIFTIQKVKVNQKLWRKFFITLCTMLFVVLIFGITKSNFYIAIQDKLTLLKIIEWNRFYFLAPFLWYLIFAISLKILLDFFNSKSATFLALLLIFGQFIYILTNNQELKINYSKILQNLELKNLQALEKHSKYPSLKEFYDPELFDSIKKFIGVPQNQYRIISIGIFPEISAYNGFYCLDSYQRNYPLTYKKQFRKIIQLELEKSKLTREYFDNWGNRCYVMPAELNKKFSIYKFDEQKTLQNILIDKKEFNKMNGKYVFSTVRINTLINKQFHFLREFSRKNSYWKIFLYEV